MKIQNSYQNNPKLSHQNKNQHHVDNKKSIIRNHSNRRNYLQRKTPLPLIKINGQLKNTSKPQDNPQMTQQKSQPTTIKAQKINEKQLLPFRKTHQIGKKKINFEINYNNVQKQYKQFGNLFIHALTKLSCDQRFIQVQKQNPVSKNFPQSLVNIFYGQTIHKYNPYIEALDRLYESFQGKISREMMQRIKKLCYIGLAKNHLKSQIHSKAPKYSRVNILIRTYMYENMRSIIEEKAENYQNIIFIPCNKDAMSFSHKQFPKQLASICRKQNFQKTIENVNTIIEGHYISYKQMNSKQTVTDRWGQNFCYLLTFLFLLIFLLTKNVVFIYIVGFFIIVSLLLYLYETRQTLSMLGTSKNIIPKIQNSLKDYLKQINTHNMEWKVGQDFYWLQIHYIKKMKKKAMRNTQE